MKKRFAFVTVFLLGICNLQGIRVDHNLDEESSFPMHSALVTEKEEDWETCYFEVVYPVHHHCIIRVSNPGDKVYVYTEDQAKWEVNENYLYLVKLWGPKDTIVITQNRTCCSKPDYPYKMINQSDGSEIEVRLRAGPNYNGSKTRWIAGLDVSKRIVILDNGLRFRAASSDVIETWEHNDTIICGEHTHWSAAFLPSSCCVPKSSFPIMFINVEDGSCGAFVELSSIKDIESTAESLHFQ